MPGKTKIEWATDTLNVVTGCDKVSAGCKNCYAETFAERWRGIPGHPYEQGFDLKLWPERIDIPRRWTRPRKIFVNSMSDFWHKDIPLDFLKRVFDMMNECPQHTFQILTKRHERMLELSDHFTWTSNIWMGVSVEDQDATKRIGYLQETAAMTKFLSIEPLIGPLELGKIGLNGINWVIIGGESGPGARVMKPEWLLPIIDTARCYGCAVFVKQMGTVMARQYKFKSKKGEDMSEWPPPFQHREFPKEKVTHV